MAWHGMKCLDWIEGMFFPRLHVSFFFSFSFFWRRGEWFGLCSLSLTIINTFLPISKNKRGGREEKVKRGICISRILDIHTFLTKNIENLSSHLSFLDNVLYNQVSFSSRKESGILSRIFGYLEKKEIEKNRFLFFFLQIQVNSIGFDSMDETTSNLVSLLRLRLLFSEIFVSNLRSGVLCPLYVM